MGKTVFYAWQGDLPDKLNRYFIRDAAEDAIKQLQAEMAVKEAPRLDHDTKGIAGHPDIAGTIFDKIDTCGVFLADVSLVGATSPQDAEPKLLPNPNVMIELGYALRARSSEHVLLVMNTAFGGPDKLPFDLRYRRHPITYHLPPERAEDRGSVRNTLTSSIKAALKVMLAAQAEHDAEELDAARSKVRTRILEQHRQFSNTVLRHRFHDFEPDQGVLTMSVVPERPLPRGLDFSDQKLSTLELPTISGQPTTFERFGRSLAAINFDLGNRPLCVSELQQDGSIFAADGFLLADTLNDTNRHRYLPEVKGVVPSIALEQQLIESVVHYVGIQRTLGVKGAIQVYISMFRIHNFVMGVGEHVLPVERSRLYLGDEIRPDPVVIDVAQQLDFQQVAAQLRPMLDFIWREFGFARSHHFNADGRWVGESRAR